MALRAGGYEVFASDISGPALGCRDATEIDFLTATALPAGVVSIVTSPPLIQPVLA